MPRTTIGLAELPEVPHFLYWLFDRTDVLLYIGITNDPKARFKHHRRHKEWWADVDQTKTRIDYFPTRNEALTAEAKAIREKQPLYNDQHNLTVDTPQRKVAAEAVADFADLVLSHMLVHPAEVKQAIEEAEDDIAWAVAGGEEPHERNPTVLAAANVAERMPTLVNVYRLAFDKVLEWLPADVVWPAHKQAAKDLGIDPANMNDDDRPDLIEAAVSLIDDEMSRRYLDGLDPKVAGEWRQSARTFLGSRAWHQHEATDDEVTRHAAAYAKSVHEGIPYLLSAYQCREPGQFTPRCPNEGIYTLVFGNCPQCDGAKCRGHDGWCGDHLVVFIDGELTWSKTGEVIAVESASESEKLVSAEDQAA